MPYFFETKKIGLPKEKDARRKLTDADKDVIRSLYQQGQTIRSIARSYEHRCCRRTIQFILFPERLKACNYSGHWKKYYDKDKQTIAMRKHRRRKNKILKDEN